MAAKAQTTSASVLDPATTFVTAAPLDVDEAGAVDVPWNPAPEALDADVADAVFEAGLLLLLPVLLLVW